MYFPCLNPSSHDDARPRNMVFGEAGTRKPGDGVCGVQWCNFDNNKVARCLGNMLGSRNNVKWCQEGWGMRVQGM